jgi:hypothetical protein
VESFALNYFYFVTMCHVATGNDAKTPISCSSSIKPLTLLHPSCSSVFDTANTSRSPFHFDYPTHPLPVPSLRPRPLLACIDTATLAFTPLYSNFLRHCLLLACIDTATLTFTHTCPPNHYWCPPSSPTVLIRRILSSPLLSCRIILLPS